MTDRQAQTVSALKAADPETSLIGEEPDGTLLLEHCPKEERFGRRVGTVLKKPMGVSRTFVYRVHPDGERCGYGWAACSACGSRLLDGDMTLTLPVAIDGARAEPDMSAQYRGVINPKKGAEWTRTNASGEVWFSGSDDEVREHLETLLGTDAFRLIGSAIELELPLVGKDMRPRSTGETTRVRFVAPSAWGIYAPGQGHWWHAVAEGARETLCTIPLSSWRSGVLRDDDQAVTCPWCRARMIAIQVAAPPAPGSGVRWASRCVYTMRHSEDLEAALVAGGSAAWDENRAWKSGRALVDGAASDERVPIIFSAAERDSGLIFYAQLESVELGDVGTRYAVHGLQRLPDVRPLSSLTVVSSGDPLPDSYIRPYAICWTPSFLSPPARERADVSESDDEESRPTLHAEIAAILRAGGSGWQTTQWLADEVNRRGRFRKRDASAVTAFQIHGRTRNYKAWFERDGSRVKLRDDAPSS